MDVAQKTALLNQLEFWLVAEGYTQACIDLQGEFPSPEKRLANMNSANLPRELREVSITSNWQALEEFLASNQTH